MKFTYLFKLSSNEDHTFIGFQVLLSITNNFKYPFLFDNNKDNYLLTISYLQLITKN